LSASTTGSDKVSIKTRKRRAKLGLFGGLIGRKVRPEYQVVEQILGIRDHLGLRAAAGDLF